MEETVITASTVTDNEGIRDVLLQGLTGLVDEHLGSRAGIGLDLSSLLQGKVTIDGSKYVDKAVTQLIAKLEELKLTQFSIPEFTANFSQELCCLAIPGVAQFKDGVVEGLNGIKRFEPTEVVVDVSGDKLISAKTSIGIEELAYSCPTALDFLGLLKSESLTKAVIRDVKLAIGIGLTKGLKFDLDLFDFKSDGKLTDFAGLPPSVLNVVQDAVEDKIKQKLKSFLQQDIKTLFMEIVGKLEFLQ